MNVTNLRRAVIGAVVLQLIAGARNVHAQDVTGRVAVEAVASASVSSADGGDPFLIFDETSTVAVGRGWDVIVRPWARRMPGGDWAAEMYQLQIRYTSTTRVPIRVDAGIICSPIGLSTLELRPDVNPTIGAPFYYFVPMPAVRWELRQSHADVGRLSAGRDRQRVRSTLGPSRRRHRCDADPRAKRVQQLEGTVGDAAGRRRRRHAGYRPAAGRRDCGWSLSSRRDLAADDGDSGQ